MSLLEVKHLKTELVTYRGNVKAVRDIDFAIDEQEIVAIVGESGCGKTMTCMSVMNLFAGNSGRISEDSEIIFEGQNLARLKEKELRRIRGAKIGMVFQDPAKALNPTERIGAQITDILREHKKLGRREAEDEARKLLRRVGINDEVRRMKQYPHELSGGMCQRVVIAMAIACKPRLLIADEPTTALDVTIQAQILELLEELKAEYKMSILLVTHNLGVVASVADRVMIMYGGKILEMGTTEEIFYRPRHPYTRALLETILGDGNRGRPLRVIPGTPPGLLHPPKGCPFLARCKERMKICSEEFPEGYMEGGHRCHCFLRSPEYLRWREGIEVSDTLHSLSLPDARLQS